MAINFKGHVFQDDGDAVNGATVQLLEAGTTTVKDSTTSNSDGLWSFSESDVDKYDVKITSGTSVRYIRWDDWVSFQELDVRNNAANTTPAATFTNFTDNASNQVAVFSGANATRADNDEIYMSFKLADSAGNLDEFARMTVVATDVTSGSEDGQIEFDVIKGGQPTKVWTITSSTGAAMSFDMNVDALTIGSGADTDVSLTFDANSADGVITWMEDEDYFKFSDEILMNSTEKILFGDTGTFIHQSSDGVLTITSDTTVDINGAVAFDGALSGITNITLSGTLSDSNYTFDTSGNVSGLGTVASGAITSSGIIKTDDATDATSTTDGSLQTDGGLSVVKDAVFGDDIKLLSDSAVIALGADGDTTLTHTDGTGLTLNSTNKLTFGDTGTFIHQSADGVLTIESDTTVDINGAVALNGAVTGATNITLSGELDAATLDISGNADIDGTTNLDAVDIDGAVQIDAAFTSGVDGQGYDTKFFGDTSGAYILWDTSADKLLTAGGAVVDIVKDKLLIGGTAVTTTAAELNVLDAVTAGTVSASLGVVVDSNKDIGSFRNVTLTGELDAGSLDISGNADIDGTTNLDAVDIDGNVQLDGTLTVGVDDTGLDVKFFGASAGAYMEWDESADQLRIMGASADATTSTGKLLLATSLTDINANDVIGKIDFQAPHEAGGTDATAVAASIQAIAQGTFSSSVNATDLIFYTGHSEAATEKFRFTSQGEIGVGGANYGTDGQVLTSGGAGAAPAWEDAGGSAGINVTKSSVGHGITGIAGTTVYGLTTFDDADGGGLKLIGLTDTDHLESAIVVEGILGGAAQTAKGGGATALGVVALSANIKSGTGITEAGSDGNLVSIDNQGSVRFIFDAEGTGHADSDWTTYSDNRLKQDQEALPYGLAEILRLTPKIYTRSSGALNNGEVTLTAKSSEIRRQIGFIAQEVKEIIPEIVREIDETKSFYSLNDGKIMAVAVKAIQELSTQVNALDARITVLESA